MENSYTLPAKLLKLLKKYSGRRKSSKGINYLSAFMFSRTDFRQTIITGCMSKSEILKNVKDKNYHTLCRFRQINIIFILMIQMTCLLKYSFIWLIDVFGLIFVGYLRKLLSTSSLHSASEIELYLL
jgi:hypothetical protein